MLDRAVRGEGDTNVATAAEHASRREARVERVKMTKPVEERAWADGGSDRGDGPVEIIRLAREDHEVETLLDALDGFDRPPPANPRAGSAGRARLV